MIIGAININIYNLETSFHTLGHEIKREKKKKKKRKEEKRKEKEQREKVTGNTR